MRIAGRILLVADIALDVLELGIAVDADLEDADQKLGKKTLLNVASIGGSWVGAALGAQLGAVAGAAAGPAAPIVIPVLGLLGGVAGSFAGDALTQWVVDITYVGDFMGFFSFFCKAKLPSIDHNPPPEGTMFFGLAYSYSKGFRMDINLMSLARIPMNQIGMFWFSPMKSWENYARGGRY